MKELTKIKEYRKKAGLNQRELSDLSGIPLGTLRRWEQSGSDIRNAQRLIPIATSLNCTVDQLLGIENNYAARGTPEFEVSEPEKRLIIDFRKLDEGQKGRAIGYIRALADEAVSRDDTERADVGKVS